MKFALQRHLSRQQLSDPNGSVHYPLAIPNVALQVDSNELWQQQRVTKTIASLLLFDTRPKGSTHSCGQVQRPAKQRKHIRRARHRPTVVRTARTEAVDQLELTVWPARQKPSVGSWPSWRKQFCTRLQTKIAATQETNSKNLLLKSIKELRRPSGGEATSSASPPLFLDRFA